MQSIKQEEEGSDASSLSNEIVTPAEVAGPLLIAPNPLEVLIRKRYHGIWLTQQRCRCLCLIAENLVEFVGACRSQPGKIVCESAEAMMRSTHCWDMEKLLRSCGVGLQTITESKEELEQIVIGQLRRLEFVPSDGKQYGPIEWLSNNYTSFVHEGSLPPFTCQDNADGSGLLSSCYQELWLCSRIIVNEALCIHKANASTVEQARAQKAEMAALTADCDGEGGWKMAKRAFQCHMQLRCIGYLAYPHNWGPIVGRYRELKLSQKWLELLDFDTE